MIVKGGTRRANRRRPSLGRLHGFEHGVVAVDEVGEHVVVVERVPVPGVEGRRRPAHEHGVGNDLLEPGRRGENALEGGADLCHVIIISDNPRPG